jgi:D-arabinose 1-dehydrogenase-like Zn-dependent alcohol dehydrogenase
MASKTSERASSWQSYRIARFGEPLELQCEEIPSVSGTEVLVKVVNCGVCHSDVHIADGYFDLGNGRKTPIGKGEKNLPLTPGHEIVGEIVAMGGDANGVAPGDRRIVFPWIGCGRSECFLCSSGQEHMCGGRTLGVVMHGGFSSHVVVPHPRYLVAYEGIPEASAGTYACSGLTAYGALKKVGRLADGDRLLIVGAGGVGLAAVSLAKELVGVAPIVAEIDKSKSELALKAGAASVIDPSQPNAAREFTKETGGAAAVVDFVGSEASAKFAVSALRRTGKLLVVGLFGGNFQMPVSYFPLLGISIEGSQVGSLQDLKELVALGQKGHFNAVPVVARPLAQANEAVTDLRNGRVRGRVVLSL